MTTFPHLRAAIVSQPWAILPDRLEAIAEVLERRFSGVRLEPEEIAAIKGARDPNGSVSLWALNAAGNMGIIESVEMVARGPADGQPANGGVIAVINVMGVIAQHASQVDNISGPGGTSVERITNSFRSAMAEPAVSGIVFNIDSPGGNVNGIQALSDEIFNARGRKPMVAQVNSTMASAAVWIGTSADQVIMSPGAMAGSIGVYALHKDVSVAAEKQGVKMTFVSAGKYKVEGNQFEPLTDQAHGALQDQVNAFYGDFTSAVARNRGVKASDVQNGFGEGRMLKDNNAVKAGLADRVAPLDDTLRRMASGKIKAGGARAQGTTLITAIDGHELIGAEKADAAAMLERLASGKATINELRAENGLPPIDETVLVVDTAAKEPVQNPPQDPAPEPEKEPEKVGETATSENDIAAKQSAESDAFRRRRHAHRMRSA